MNGIKYVLQVSWSIFRELIPQFVTEQCMVRVSEKGDYMVIEEAMPVAIANKGDEDMYDGIADIKAIHWLWMGWVFGIDGKIIFWDGSVFPPDIK